MIEQLLHTIPLPAEWSISERFDDVLRLRTLELKMMGLVASHGSGLKVFGSAAGFGSDVPSRAFYELIERISTAEAQRDGFAISDSPSGTHFRFARSNGIATERSYEAACGRAWLELIERDRVLRSWFSGAAPWRWEDELRFDGVSDLQENYTIECYMFCPPRSEQSLHVAGVFGFPRFGCLPVLMGFAGAKTAEESIRRAWTECLQRFAFLQGEEIAEQPEFAASPDYHQELFLHSARIPLLRGWLDGKHFCPHRERRLAERYPILRQEPAFKDITPSHLAGRIWIIQAGSEAVIPLVFGRWYDSVIGDMAPWLMVHPVA